MNKIRVRGELVKPPYMGTAKAGPYASVTVKIPDGNYSFWIEVYAPGAAAQAFNGAKVGDNFEVEGSLTEKKKQDGTRIVQIKAERVTKPGQAASSARPGTREYQDIAQEITDSDIPF
jgi:hypothetical protein